MKSSNIAGDEEGCLHLDLPSFGDIVTLMVEGSKCLLVGRATPFACVVVVVCAFASKSSLAAEARKRVTVEVKRV